MYDNVRLVFFSYPVASQNAQLGDKQSLFMNRDLDYAGDYSLFVFSLQNFVVDLL